ncbi:hypothetical protein MNV49_003612 [Pseudohyphozyma bogoriensis]|nr:hypothetical protein MNV49_003612 [Pseudohyphozyma bogoriensis]
MPPTIPIDIIAAILESIYDTMVEGDFPGSHATPLSSLRFIFGPFRLVSKAFGEQTTRMMFRQFTLLTNTRAREFLRLVKSLGIGTSVRNLRLDVRPSEGVDINSLDDLVRSCPFISSLYFTTWNVEALLCGLNHQFEHERPLRLRRLESLTLDTASAVVPLRYETLQHFSTLGSTMKSLNITSSGRSIQTDDVWLRPDSIDSPMPNSGACLGWNLLRFTLVRTPVDRDGLNTLLSEVNNSLEVIKLEGCTIFPREDTGPTFNGDLTFPHLVELSMTRTNASLTSVKLLAPRLEILRLGHTTSLDIFTTFPPSLTHFSMARLGDPDWIPFVEQFCETHAGLKSLNLPINHSNATFGVRRIIEIFLGHVDGVVWTEGAGI